MDIKKEIDTKEAKKIYSENKGKIVADDKYFVSLININKIYSKGNQAVFDFNLNINQGDFVALVGPSGCGKSTTLRMVAGLEEITSGELYINGILSNYLASKDRDIAMVFQSYALYPQLSVYDNIAFGLKIRKIDKKIIDEKVFKAAKILDLGNYLDRYPRELSGGQMQRVALGRAIVRDAKLFLMDEPLSNLDAKLRVQMRGEIVKIHDALKATTIYVTHDQTEAMTMANKIVVMNKGVIQQIGVPMEVYDNPNSLFVATFIGTPSMNLFSATYSNGEIVLNNGYSFKASKKLIKSHDEFYSSMINKFQNILNKFETLDKDGIKKILHEIHTHFPADSSSKDEKLKHEKKANLFKRCFIKIKSLFKHNKKEDEGKQKEEEKLKEEIVRDLNHFKSSMSTSHSIILGARSEDIRLATKNDDSIKMKLSINQIEILGSEFIIYGTSNGYDIKLKIQGKCDVSNHTNIEVKLDLDKVHLFDEVTGMNLCRHEFFIKGEDK